MRSASSTDALSVGVVGLGALMAVLPQTLVLPVIPIIARDVGATTGQAQWLLTSTLLAGAVAVPVISRFADLWGRRLMLQFTLVFLAVGSAVDALTDNLALMIVGRALAGVAAATVPLGISLLAATLPRERQASGMVIVSAMLGVGNTLGLPLAGLIGDRADYHVLYRIGFAGAVISVVLVSLVVREPRAAGQKDSKTPRSKVDLPGIVLLTAGLGGLILPLAQGAEWGWGSTRTLGTFATAVVLLVLLVVVELHTSSPLVNMRALAHPPVAITNVASAFVGFALFASFVGASTYVQAPTATGYGFNASVVTAGLTLLPSGLLMLLLAPVAARLIKRWGAAWVLCLAGMIIAVGLIERIAATAALWQVIAGTAIVGVGSGIAYAALPSLITAHSRPDELAAANGINSVARSLGSTLASAAGGSILAALTMNIDGTPVPSLTGYRTLFVICAAAAALAAAGGAVVARADARTRPQPDNSAPTAGAQRLPAADTPMQ
ncbi:MFS transporter [Streptomyces sp. CoH17]|uniref:MFS transporter n=1 Tax=Streptomyces sp. CoH17 TaxID=2992806 RepID=UPI0022712ADC|nr:MFS transporter [Streptomyces sp. CoH17]